MFREVTDKSIREALKARMNTVIENATPIELKEMAAIILVKYEHAAPTKKPTTPRKATRVSKKRRFSTKGKAAISQGMKEYWARRKALKAKVAKKS